MDLEHKTLFLFFYHPYIVRAYNKGYTRWGCHWQTATSSLQSIGSHVNLSLSLFHITIRFNYLSLKISVLLSLSSWLWVWGLASTATQTLLKYGFTFTTTFTFTGFSVPCWVPLDLHQKIRTIKKYYETFNLYGQTLAKLVLWWTFNSPLWKFSNEREIVLIIGIVWGTKWPQS